MALTGVLRALALYGLCDVAHALPGAIGDYSITLELALINAEPGGRAPVVRRGRVDVQITVAADPIEGFEEEFVDSDVCLVLDGLDGAGCWPLVDMVYLPRLLGVEDGMHSLSAYLTHPDTGAFLLTPSSGLVDFEMKDASEHAAQMDGEDTAVVTEGEEKEEDDLIQVEIPVLEIQEPEEMLPVDGASAEIAYAVRTSESAEFEKWFNRSLVCTSLDAAKHHFCWPIFNVEYYPRITALGPGVHAIKAVTTHPHTGEMIPGSQSTERAFLTHAPSPFDTDLSAFRAVLNVTLEADGVESVVPVQPSADSGFVAFRFCQSRGSLYQACVTDVERRIAAARARPPPAAPELPAPDPAEDPKASLPPEMKSNMMLVAAVCSAGRRTSPRCISAQAQLFDLKDTLPYEMQQVVLDFIADELV